MCMDASVQTCPKLLPFALLSACNCSSVVSGHPGRGDDPYWYFTRGTEVQRNKSLEELGTGIWTLWFDTCRIFFFSLLFSTQSFPFSCYKCVFFHWFSLHSFSPSCIWPISPLLNTLPPWLLPILLSLFPCWLYFSDLFSPNCCTWVVSWVCCVLWQCLIFPLQLYCCMTDRRKVSSRAKRQKEGRGKRSMAQTLPRKQYLNGQHVTSSNFVFIFFVKRDLLSGWEQLITSEKVADLKVSHSSREQIRVRSHCLFQCTASQFFSGTRGSDYWLATGQLKSF